MQGDGADDPAERNGGAAVKVWKLNRKSRLPVLRGRPYRCAGKSDRAAVPLSGRNGGPLVPKHWTPKSDADGIARIREELALLEELDRYCNRYTIVW